MSLKLSNVNDHNLFYYYTSLFPTLICFRKLVVTLIFPEISIQQCLHLVLKISLLLKSSGRSKPSNIVGSFFTAAASIVLSIHLLSHVLYMYI